jgi:short-subunit dehydrogenase involved in D-alanine esterification of teichoic acids
MMDFAGKRVLVTGATGGIGGALALALRTAGAVVVVHGRDARRLGALADAGFETVAAELDEPGAAVALVAQVLAGGPLDVLVNNAAVQVLMDFRGDDVEGQLASLDRELAVNLRAPIHLTRLFLPTLLARPAAAVVNISSGLALVPKQSSPVYCATKAALHSFSRSLRWQLDGTSVRVFEALPPVVDTEMTRGRGTGKISPERCAAEILRGLQRDQATHFVGRSAWLAAMARLAPDFAERIMRRS